MSVYFQGSLFDPPPRPLPDAIGHAAVRAIESNQLLLPGKGRMDWCDYTLNPYRGCSFGCSYCYAAFFVADDAQRADWGNWVEVKIRALETLGKKDLRGKRIFMSSATDPYQPLEAKLEFTRAIVSHLAEQQAHLIVQTRSPIAARDADLFARFDKVRVNMSITTDDDEIRRRFEPQCASVERRLEAVEKLKAAGIRVAVSVCPMLPMKDPAAFARRLMEIGVHSAYASYFHTGDRAFAAGTRDRAWELAREMGWDEAAFERTKAIFKNACDAYGRSSDVFGPV